MSTLQNNQKLINPFIRLVIMFTTILPLLSALVLSSTVVIIRRGLTKSNALNASLILTLIGNLVLWPLAILFTNFATIPLESILFFAIAGILSPGITRLFYIKGMESVGTSATSSITAISPMLSSLFAVFLFNEVLTVQNWGGILSIIVGAILIERSIAKPAHGTRTILKKGLIFPLLGTLTITFGQILRKFGLNSYDDPLGGVTIGYIFALLTYLLLVFSSGSYRTSFSLQRDFGLFWKPGLILPFGWLLAYYALSYEQISIATPLMGTEPLFVLLWCYLYLKEYEVISIKLVVGALLIFTGVVAVSTLR